jgi:hypothetical protein
MKRRLLRFFALAALTALAGCVHPAINDSARTGPFYTPRNFRADVRLAPGILRVVLLPVHGGTVASAQTVEGLDALFAEALEHQARFEVVTLSREECAKTFGVPDLGSTDELPHDFLRILAEKFDAQGVLFVDLTAYAAYRPLVLGLRAKLATVGDRQMIWSFDEIFSTSNPLIVNSIRHFYIHNELGSVPVDLTTDALQSPNRFAAYAADTMFRTLPQR